jgi:hypothetical protein
MNFELTEKQRAIWETARRLADAALQRHGDYGFFKEFPAERHVRDLCAHQILERTNEVLRVIIAREPLHQ